MKTIADEWEDFWHKVKPSNASKVQFEEMRTSFYAGAYSFLMCMWEMGDMSDRAGAMELNKLHQEVESFLEQDAKRRLGDETETSQDQNEKDRTIH
ncbi:MAG: hypothetical protein AM326_01560 [Candidatus Thorarchaeota archaeon SMTZ-45]|nr:MAG: hypothetical protein AM326_01560 [Candidatus Thorarchaeota archaeon SMTZ-45]